MIAPRALGTAKADAADRLRLPTTLASDLRRRHLVTVGSVWRI